MGTKTEIVTGHVKKGKFNAFDRRKFAMAFLPFEGQDVELRVSKLHKKRSDAQNAYWWGVVIKIFMSPECLADDDKDAVHDIVRGEIHYNIKEVRGRKVKTLLRTRGLSTVEFSELVARAQKLGAEWFGVYIPDPNEELAGMMMEDEERKTKEGDSL